MHPDRHSFTLVIVVLAGALLAVATGCSMTHRERAAKAEEHWGQVRAKIKLQMAGQQFERGQTADALKLLDKALAWDSENPAAHLLLARCRIEDGKLSAATRAIERAAECSAGDNADIAAIQGLIAERKGELDTAIGFYQQARQFDDTVVGYLISEAECLVAQSKTQAARTLLNEQLLNYDNDPSVHALIGEIALRDGDSVAAAQAFRAVLAAGDHDPVIAEEYALLATRTGQYNDALSVLEPIIADRGEQDVSPSVLRAAAECMLALHRTEPAKRTLHQVLDRDPDDAQAWLLLARAGIATRDAHSTRSAAKNLRRLAPRDPQSYVIDAYACVQERRFAAAEKSLRDALELNGDDVLAYCMLGLVAERESNPAAARDHYEHALTLDSECAWALAALRRLGADSAPSVLGAGDTDSAADESMMARGSDVSELR